MDRRSPNPADGQTGFILHVRRRLLVSCCKIMEFCFVIKIEWNVFLMHPLPCAELQLADLGKVKSRA